MEKELFTIAQAANACSISRSTLLRMEDEGLLRPAKHEEGRYRYYDTDNVLQALRICSLHRMGLTNREIRPLMDTPPDSDGVIERLEAMRESLNIIITDLKKRTLKDSSTKTELVDLPELQCYIRSFEMEGTQAKLEEKLYEVLTEAIERGCRLNGRRDSFIRVFRPDVVDGQYEFKAYRYYFCVPVLGYPRGCPNIETVIRRKILSVTWQGEVTDVKERTLALSREAGGMGLTPSGWFHLIILPSQQDPDSKNAAHRLLQVGCIVN